MKKILVLILSVSFLTGVSILVKDYQAPVSVQAASVNTKKVNKALATRLKEDQRFADQGSDDFAFSKYAYKFKVNKDKSLDIYVTGDFKQLSNSEKNEVAHKLQSSASSVLYEENVINDSEYREKPITEFYLNKDVSLGVSKVFNHSEFHWNKN